MLFFFCGNKRKHVHGNKPKGNLSADTRLGEKMVSDWGTSLQFAVIASMQITRVDVCASLDLVATENGSSPTSSAISPQSSHFRYRAQMGARSHIPAAQLAHSPINNSTSFSYFFFFLLQSIIIITLRYRYHIHFYSIVKCRKRNIIWIANALLSQSTV